MCLPYLFMLELSCVIKNEGGYYGSNLYDNWYLIFSKHWIWYHEQILQKAIIDISLHPRMSLGGYFYVYIC